MSGLGNLDAACPVCGKRAGSHTLDDQARCMRVLGTDDAYHEDFRARFDLPEDVLIADSVVAKALVLHGEQNMPGVSFDPRAGQVRVDVAAVLQEFSTSASGTQQVVARVLYLAPSEGMTKYGKLVRDTANGAVNAAARAQGMRPADVRKASKRFG